MKKSQKKEKPRLFVRQGFKKMKGQGLEPPTCGLEVGLINHAIYARKAFYSRVKRFSYCICRPM